MGKEGPGEVLLLPEGKKKPLGMLGLATILGRGCIFTQEGLSTVIDGYCV